MYQKTDFKKTISMLNDEAKKIRKMERRKFKKKAEHIRKIRDEIETRELEKCPEEMIMFKDIKVFKKREIDKMKEEFVEVSIIGNVELDTDEKAILKLPPKFAIRRKLDIVNFKTEQEMGMAKVRYQVHKDNRVRELEEVEIESGETMENNNSKKYKPLNIEEIEELDEMEIIEAE